MDTCWTVFVVIWTLVSVLGQRTLPTDPDQLLSPETETVIKNIMYFGHQALEPSRHALATARKKTQPKFKGPFPCRDTKKFRSRKRPRSVHQLMPGDIDVVAAMGDSLIAGMGGSGFTQVGSLIEDRGYSWGAGGQGTWRDALTLPNILRQYNPDLLGFSTNTGPVSSRQAGFNVAEPGALARHMPAMARVLVQRIRSDRRVNFRKHWKLVTLLIGNNDVCSDMCYLPNPGSVVKTLRESLTEALDFLRDHLPRTIVNVLPITSLQKLPLDYDFPGVCYLPHRIFCPCLFGPRFQQKYFSQIVQGLQNVTIDVVTRGRYNLQTFTVVLQPLTLNADLPYKKNKGREPDLMDLAPDCFHFSQHGCAKAANALWNNMLQPVGAKLSTWEPLMERFLCPSQAFPYIFTASNSPR